MANGSGTTANRLRDATPNESASVLAAAKKYLGKPYFADAGEKSNPTSGFDCSGLVWYAISKEGGFTFDYKSSNHLAMYPMLRRLQIPPEQLQAGDIMLFASHVGFYDPSPPKTGKVLFSATSHGVRYEDPKYWGAAVGYFRLRVVGR